MARKPIMRVDPAEPPPYMCNECWFYQAETQDHGACYALPPTVLFDTDGDLLCPRTIVLSEDRGCINWKARNTPC